MDSNEIQIFFPEIKELEVKKAQLQKAVAELTALRTQVIEQAREIDRHVSHGTHGSNIIWGDPIGNDNDSNQFQTLVPTYERIGELKAIVGKAEKEVEELEKKTVDIKQSYEKLKKEVEQRQETEWNNPISSISLDE